MKQILNKFVNLDYKVHLSLAFVIRMIFIAYGVCHDKYSSVPYTDVDYQVFTDASRHVLNHNSPYDRHTYRYTPLIAIILVFNITVHHTFGKILFSIIDLLVGALIRLIVKTTLKEHDNQVKINQNVNDKTPPQLTSCKQKNSKLRKKAKNRDNKSIKLHNKQTKDGIETIADISMMIWLYNPMSIAIATRGNCDSIAGFLVLAVLYYLQCKKTYFIAGLIHGIAVHVRLYPIVYSLALFMHLSKFSFYEVENRKRAFHKAIENNKQIKDMENKIVKKSNLENTAVAKSVLLQREKRTIFKRRYLLYLIPNFDQLKLIFGTAISLLALTALFYYLYGYKFLYETYIYHLIREDPKHNFSLYFYLQYLTVGIKNVGIWQKVLTTLPKLVLLLVLSIRYGLNRYSLNFSILTQTIVIVIFNTVLTSQYFVWILAILPLCIWQIKISLKKVTVLFTIWLAAQCAWLLPAYFLEFQGQNTFLLIWIQSVAFFCANIAILGRIIKYFVPVGCHMD